MYYWGEIAAHKGIIGVQLPSYDVSHSVRCRLIIIYRMFKNINPWQLSKYIFSKSVKHLQILITYPKNNNMQCVGSNWWILYVFFPFLFLFFNVNSKIHMYAQQRKVYLLSFQRPFKLIVLDDVIRAYTHKYYNAFLVFHEGDEVLGHH